MLATRRYVIHAAIAVTLALINLITLTTPCAASVACPPGGCSGGGGGGGGGGPVVTNTVIYANSFSFGPGNDDRLNINVQETVSTAAPTFYTYAIEVLSSAANPPVSAAIPLTNPLIFDNYTPTVAAGTPYAGIFGSAYPYVAILSNCCVLYGNTPPYQYDQIYNLTTSYAPVEGLYGTRDELGVIATFDPPVPGGVPVPEPSSMMLLGTGVLVVATWSLRRQH